MKLVTITEKNTGNFICFAAESKYEERMIPKSAGFRWNPNAKRWETKEAKIANRLREYATEPTAARLEEMLENYRSAIWASKATGADISVPAPEGFTYLPFQKAGIAYASGRPATLIGDEMGLGKTIQAIGLINADRSVKNALVICPASLKINWARELEKWLVRSLTVEIANGGKLPETNVVVINYDILTRHNKALREREWDILIVDECHYLKNPKAQRTAQVLGKWHREPEKKIEAIPAKKKVFLTGTPILNRPIELWPLLSALDKNGLGRSWKYFVTRYCEGHQNGYGWDVSGASNLDELQEKLRATIMVRRLKKDVLTELPAKRRQIIELPANGCIGAIKAETKAWEKQEAKLNELRVKVELAKASDNPEEYEEAVKKLRESARIAFTEISKLRHETALAKVPAVLDHLKDTLEAVDKIVLFAHHKDVIEALRNELGNECVILTGDCSQEERQAAVDRFQTDETCKVFIGSIGAAGVGITLTAASMVVFAELDWVPGNITQAEDRCHRIGQTESVLVQHLVLDGSLDAKMAKTLVEKQEVIDAALDDEIKIEEPVIPTLDEVATKNTGRKIIEEEATGITEEQIEAVHTGLQILAGMCDGACQLDGMGFNKIDTAIGHSLAGAIRLSPKQAVLGKRIIKKYHRQLPEELMSAIRGGVPEPALIN